MTSDQGPAPNVCPACGARAEEPARFCPACGRRLGGAAPDVDMAGWIQAAWRLFVSDIPLAIAIGLVLVVPAVVCALLGYFGMFALAILADPEVGAPKAAFPAAASGLGLVFLVVGLLWPALQGGVYACFLEGMRTGKLTTRQLGTGFRHWWACTWVVWLLMAANLLCLPCMCFLIGIPLSLAVGTLAWLSLFRIVDAGRGGMEALSFTSRLLHGRFWVMLVYSLLMWALMSAGVMGMYVGVLITVPVGVAALAAGYDSLRGKAEPSPQA